MKPSCWEAYTNSDLTEGRGSDVTIAFFTNEAAAIRAARGRGPMGSDAYVRPHQKPMIFDSYEAYAASQKQDIRRQALAKLSQEEKRELGLVDEDS